jgi:hypothetical protein
MASIGLIIFFPRVKWNFLLELIEQPCYLVKPVCFPLDFLQVVIRLCLHKSKEMCSTELLELNSLVALEA